MEKQIYEKKHTSVSVQTDQKVWKQIYATALAQWLPFFPALPCKPSRSCGRSFSSSISSSQRFPQDWIWHRTYRDHMPFRSGNWYQAASAMVLDTYIWAALWLGALCASQRSDSPPTTLTETPTPPDQGNPAAGPSHLATILYENIPYYRILNFFLKNIKTTQ